MQPLCRCCLVFVRVSNIRGHTYFVFYLLQYKTGIDLVTVGMECQGPRCISFHRAAIAQRVFHASQFRKMSGEWPCVYNSIIKIKMFTKSLVQVWLKAERYLNMLVYRMPCLTVSYALTCCCAFDLV